MAARKVRVFDGLATGHHRRKRRPAPRMSPALRQQLHEYDGPDPAEADALSWRPCPCGSWHYLAERCPDE